MCRNFCASELPGQKLAGAPPELALVVFHTHGPYSGMPIFRPCPSPCQLIYTIKQVLHLSQKECNSNFGLSQTIIGLAKIIDNNSITIYGTKNV